MKGISGALFIGVAMIALSSCGGGGQSEAAPTSATAPPPVPQSTGSDDSGSTGAEKGLSPSASLAVDAAFDFRVDSDVTVLVSSMETALGALNFYHASAFVDEGTGTHYPDYDTRIATWRPTVGKEFVVRVNDNWDGLLLEFVPDTAAGEERYLYFPRAELGGVLVVAL